MAYTDTARSPKDIDDLVKSTQELLVKKGALTNLMSDLTQYVGLNELYKKHQKVFSGGLDWRFDAIMDHNHTARHVKLYQNDTNAHVDAIVTGKVSPRFTDASYVYDLREPALQHGDAVQIYNFVNNKLMQMKQSVADLLEADIWGTPIYSSDDTTPYGIPFWVQKGVDATVAAAGLGGFLGVDPVMAESATVSTTSTVPRAGIASATYARWKNWTARYTAITKDDLIKKMRYAFLKTDFKSPISMAEPTVGSGSGIYVGSDTIMEMESILEAQNMNLGNDLASKDGKCTFKGKVVTHVPKLDEDTTDPVYFLDWNTLAVGMLAGWTEHLSAPIPVPNQHNARQVFMDGGWNMICTNLRKQGVICKSAS